MRTSPGTRSRMGTRTMVGALALASSLLAASIANADKDEWRLGGGGVITLTTASVGGADGTGLGFDVHGRVARSITNALELGLMASYGEATDVAFAGATLEGQTGTLFADLRTASVAVELRFTPGVALARAFERTGP